MIVIENCNPREYLSAIRTVVGRYPFVRFVSEPRLGISYARSRAVAESAGELVGFIDDDAYIATDWISSVSDAFRRYPDAGAIGGSIRLEHASPPPKWLREIHRLYLAEFLRGEEAELEYPHFPRGANMAFRKKALEGSELFSSVLGKVGESLQCFEEIDVCYRLRQRGWKSYFIPSARATHIIEPYRHNPAWFRKRAYEQGKSVRLFQRIRSLQQRHGSLAQQLRTALMDPDDMQRMYMRGYLVGNVLPMRFIA